MNCIIQYIYVYIYIYIYIIINKIAATTQYVIVRKCLYFILSIIFSTMYLKK